MSIRAIYEALQQTHQLTDAEFLAEINDKKTMLKDYHPNKTTWESDSVGERQVRGMHSNATFGARLGSTQLGTFLSLLRGAISQYRSAGDQASLGTAEVLEGFLNRFNTTIYGLDFTDAEIRSQISQLYQSVGADPQPVLDLGYTLISTADELLGRDATQADVDEVKAAIEAAQDAAAEQQAAIDLQIEYDAKFNQHVSTALFTGDRAGVVAGLRAFADAMEVE